MSLRDKLNANSTASTIGAIVILVVALGVLWVVVRGSDPVVDREALYFYDVETNQLYLGDTDLVPPADAPSGPGNGARAYVYGCGGCPRARDVEGTTPDALRELGAFVGWVEKYDERLHRLQSTPPSEWTSQQREMIQSAELYEFGTLIRSPDAEEWVAMGSRRGEELRDPIRLRGECPDNQTPRACNP